MTGDFSAPVVDFDYAVLLDGGRRVHEVVTLGNGDWGYINYHTLDIAQAYDVTVLLQDVETSVRESLLSLISPAHTKQVGGGTSIQ